MHGASFLGQTKWTKSQAPAYSLKPGAGVFTIVGKFSMVGNATGLSFGVNYCVEINETVRFFVNLQVGRLLMGTMSVICVCTVRQCVHDVGTRLNHPSPDRSVKIF
jgi:hypothetical protein